MNEAIKELNKMIKDGSLAFTPTSDGGADVSVVKGMPDKEKKRVVKLIQEASGYKDLTK